LPETPGAAPAPFAAAAVPAAPDLGRVGRYHLVREIATGGMATVYLARLEGEGGFEKQVALKCILPHLARDPGFVAMFLDEARIASRIGHPNVCQVFDFGCSDGRYFLAMEALEGVPLSAVLRRPRPVGPDAESRDVAVALRIAGDACEGLHAAHDLVDADGRPLEVVHRDVSPQNLFVTRGGLVKVLDFGIARARSQVHRTATGELKGNIAYASPEQIRGRAIDRRADLWSLGVILWELLARRRLFARPTPVEMMYAVLQDPVPALAELRPGVPPGVEALVLRLLSRDPAGRPPNARAVQRELQTLAEGLGGWPSSPDVAEWVHGIEPELAPAGEGDAPPVVETTTAATHVATPRPTAPVARPASRTIAMAAVALGLLAFAGVGALVAWPTASEEPGPPPHVLASPAPRTSEIAAPPPAPPRALAEPSTAPAPAAPPRARPSAPSRERPPPVAEEAPPAGRLALVVPDGWARVALRGRTLGQTPLAVELPAGAHVLELRPNGQGPPRRVRVRIEPGRTTRLSVPIGP